MFNIDVVEPTAPAVEAPAPAAQVSAPAEPVNAELDKLKADYAALAAKVEASASPEPETPVTEPVDYFLDPQKAITSAVEQALAQRQAQSDRIATQAKIVADAHPDAATVAESKEFKDFLAVNPALANVYASARKGLDGAALANTLDMYKKLAVAAPAPAAFAAQDTVNLDGGVTGVTGTGRIWNRNEIQNLAATRPSEYDRLSGEITQAYLEGRVSG